MKLFPKGLPRSSVCRAAYEARNPVSRVRGSGKEVVDSQGSWVTRKVLFGATCNSTYCLLSMVIPGGKSRKGASALHSRRRARKLLSKDDHSLVCCD